MTIWQDMQAALDELSAGDLLRVETVVESACGARITMGGRQVVCLCSNDYLALAGDERVRAAAVEAIEAWGVGSGASRLLSGTSTPHVELEKQLAGFKGVEAVVVTSTGWAANGAAIGALVSAGDLILCDKLNHASIIDASRNCGAKLRTYAHRDTGRLERLLELHRREYRRCLIVTDSLFSMDGDFAPLADLVELKERFDAQILIDEAHATGVIGPGGRGVAELMGVEDRIDVTVGTLSKAIGSMGGFVAGPRVMIDTIRNTARAYIYTTALAPALCAAAAKSLEIIRDRPDRRRRLLSLADRLRQSLQAGGLQIGDSTSQIIPVIIGAESVAMAAGRALLKKGFLLPAIRPPTVPPGSSRLRISLSAAHDWADVEALAEAISDAIAQAPAPPLRAT